MKAGGPAFPIRTGDTTYRGMSLRDYFALHALKCILANPAPDAERGRQAAWDAYFYADAMLEARK